MAPAVLSLTYERTLLSSSRSGVTDTKSTLKDKQKYNKKQSISCALL